MTTRKPPLSIHSAIARAAHPFGGVGNAAAQIGREVSVVSHAANPNRQEMLRLDDAAELNRLCYHAGGGAPILDYMRAVMLAEEAPALSFFEHTASMMRESADLTGALVEALRDGELSPQERQQLKKEVEDLRTSLGALAADLEAGNA